VERSGRRRWTVRRTELADDWFVQSRENDDQGRPSTRISRLRYRLTKPEGSCTVKISVYIHVFFWPVFHILTEPVPYRPTFVVVNEARARIATWPRGLHYSVDLRIYKRVRNRFCENVENSPQNIIRGYTDIFYSPVLHIICLSILGRIFNTIHQGSAATRPEHTLPRIHVTTGSSH